MLLLSESISFTLFEELSELAGIDLISLIVAGVVSIALIVAILLYKKRTPKDQNSDVTMPQKGIDVRALVVGAMCISLAFVLSYMKIFSMPLGGSLTLLSMLPVCLYAGWYGPRYGLLAAFAYGLLQMIQGVWVVHPIQFILDYLLAFTVLGLSGFFKRSLPLGVAVACFARLICSTVSGAVFFAEYAAEAGFDNAWVYSLLYNSAYIGVEGVLCVIVSALPFMSTIKKALPGKPA